MMAPPRGDSAVAPTRLAIPRARNDQEGDSNPVKNTSEVKTVTICGGGTIGPGVALAYAMAGFDTRLADVKAEPLERAKVSIQKACQMMAEERYLSEAQAEAAQRNMSYTTDVDTALAVADFVQEAVPEVVEIKQDFYAHAETVAQPDVWLGTNTSTMKLSDITAKMKHPDRVVGVHWFAPPFLIPTVEILRGDKTPEAAIDFGVDIMKRAGKVPCVVKDIPGFILNRFQHVLLTTALEIVDEGGVTFEDVDNAFRYGLAPRFPLWGIFGTHDRGVHKRTSSQAGAYISQATGNPKYGPHPLFLQAVEQGRYGIMVGKGWYDYEGQEPAEITKQKDRELVRMMKLLRDNDVL